MTKDMTLEEKQKKLEEIKKQATVHSFFSEESGASNTEMNLIKLFRIDNLMTSIRFFIENEKQSPNREFNKNLDIFIATYRQSFHSIYEKDDLEKVDQDHILKNLMKDTKEKIDVSSKFSLNDLQNISEKFPETKTTIDSIYKSLETIKEKQDRLDGLAPSKRTNSSEEVDKEAIEIIENLTKRYKERMKVRDVKIVKAMNRAGDINLEIISKKTKNIVSPNQSLFNGMTVSDGIDRLNNAIQHLEEKSIIKKEKAATNEKIKEETKKIEEEISAEKTKINNFNKRLKEDLSNCLSNTSDLELLESFSMKDSKLKNILENCTNYDEAKLTLVNSFKEEKEIWNFVEKTKYFDLAKSAARYNYKESIIFSAMSESLKETLEIREKFVYGLKEPDKESIAEMNSLLEEHNYKIRLQKIPASNEEKPEDYQGKTDFEIANKVLEKATTPEGELGYSPYRRRNMTLGLMIAIGENNTNSVNNDADLFKKYMAIYFDKENIETIKIPEMMKKYEWNKFKQDNIEDAKTIYQEFKNNAENFDEAKEKLLNGVRYGESTTHHITPRRFASILENPDELNNQENLAYTIKWKAWEKDNHQFEHYLNLTTADDALSSNLTMKNGEFTRKKVDNLTELYYEKPQVIINGKAVDLIPHNTLLVTPNITIASPELPEKVKHLACKAFEPVSFIEKEENHELIFAKLKKEKNMELV